MSIKQKESFLYSINKFSSTEKKTKILYKKGKSIASIAIKACALGPRTGGGGSMSPGNGFRNEIVIRCFKACDLILATDGSEETMNVFMP